MRTALLATALLLAGCSTGGPAGPVPSPPPEIAVVSLPGGAHAIIQTRTGGLVANLAPGILTIGLSGGQDIAEAYLVTASGGGTAIDVLLPGKGYGLTEVASQPGSALAAVLAPAPALTTFVGLPTVLAVLASGGVITGYQHGARLWSASISGPDPVLRQVGGQVVAGGGGDWRPLDLARGELGAALGAAPCEPGPVAEVAGRLVLDCGGRLDMGAGTVPTDLPTALPSGKAVILAFPDGELWRLAGPAAHRVGRGPAWTVPPVISPDGAAVYVATGAGVEQVSPANASHHRLLALEGITSLAMSRDGNFVYALAGGALHAFTASGGAPAGSAPVSGETIQQIAGG
jgi:hypothetical protein